MLATFCSSAAGASAVLTLGAGMTRLAIRDWELDWRVSLISTALFSALGVFFIRSPFDRASSIIRQEIAPIEPEAARLEGAPLPPTTYRDRFRSLFQAGATIGILAIIALKTAPRFIGTR